MNLKNNYTWGRSPVRDVPMNANFQIYILYHQICTVIGNVIYMYIVFKRNAYLILYSDRIRSFI